MRLRRHRSARTHRRPLALAAATAALLAFALVAEVAIEAVQAPVPRTPAGTPRRRSGGDSPFRTKGFAGTSFQAAALEQPGCPIMVSVTRVTRNERGVSLALELNNLGEQPVARQVVGVWVLVRDGTVRGYQRYVGERSIDPATFRSVDVAIRTTNVLPDDLIVVALQEAGTADQPWRRDVKELEREVRRAVTQ